MTYVTKKSLFTKRQNISIFTPIHNKTVHESYKDVLKTNIINIKEKFLSLTFDTNSKVYLITTSFIS